MKARHATCGEFVEVIRLEKRISFAQALAVVSPYHTCDFSYPRTYSHLNLANLLDYDEAEFAELVLGADQ